MDRGRSLLRFALSLLLLPFCTLPLAAQVAVRVEKHEGQIVLMRGDKPYRVQGVGGQSDLDALVALGGNSIRTWSPEGLGELLDQAHAKGLTVCVGFWLGHQRHGFNYQNQDAVLKQLEDCLQVVRQFKDHPAVLIWAVGNEMEGDGKNPAVWYAVDHIAREIKQLDPNHPTMTVIAELGENSDKVRAFNRYCPNVDVLGINSYAGIESLDQRYREAGGSKPYIVTEHGPRGPWEVGRTRWGAPLEATSTEKGELYAQGFRATVLSNSANASANDPVACLGTYAFLWGNKQETTATWFGMRLPDGSRLAAAEAMSQLWRGEVSGNRCPRIEELKVDRADLLKTGQEIVAKLNVSDPDQDQLEVTWVLRHDSVTIGTGGDAQADELAIEDAITSSGTEARVRVPEGGGGYRLFAYVRDGQGNAAVANVPLYVDAPMVTLESPRAQLPYLVYGDGGPAAGKPVESGYVPSGYMGNTQAISMQLDSSQEPREGDVCLKVEYRAADQWGGVLWQSPPDDWTGAKPGGLNLTGAKAIEFWARGEAGNEKVSFMFGVVDGNFPYRDTGKAELAQVVLTTQWQKYRIPLSDLDLSRIKTGFGWSLAGSGQPITFYLDEIKYVAE